MKKFKFTLQTVLDVRRLKEEKIQKEFSAILEEKTRALRTIAKLEADLEELRQYQKARRKTHKHDNVMEALYQGRHADFVLRIDIETNRLKEIERRLELKRLELIKASKDRKVLEKLEEKQKKEYLLRIEREEQIFLDELAQHQDMRTAAGVR